MFNSSFVYYRTDICNIAVIGSVLHNYYILILLCACRAVEYLNTHSCNTWTLICAILKCLFLADFQPSTKGYSEDFDKHRATDRL